jgi:hypothetical protein
MRIQSESFQEYSLCLDYFVHVVPAGNEADLYTQFVNLFQQIYKRMEIFVPSPRNFLYDTLDSVPNLANLKVVCSHTPLSEFSNLSDFPLSVKKRIVVLRDPCDRLLADYYASVFPTTHVHVADLPEEELVAFCEMHDDVYRSFLGLAPEGPEGPDEEDILRVCNGLFAVILYESFREDVCLLAKTIGIAEKEVTTDLDMCNDLDNVRERMLPLLAKEYRIYNLAKTYHNSSRITIRDSSFE